MFRLWTTRYNRLTCTSLYEWDDIAEALALSPLHDDEFITYEG